MVRTAHNPARSCPGDRGQDRGDLGTPNLVGNPWALETERAAWLCVLAFCMTSLAIYVAVAAFMQGMIGTLGASIFFLVLGLLVMNRLARVIFGREQVRFDSRGLEYLRVDGLAEAQARPAGGDPEGHALQCYGQRWDISRLIRNMAW